MKTSEVQSIEEAWVVWSKATCDFMDAVCDDDSMELQEKAENRLDEAARKLVYAALDMAINHPPECNSAACGSVQRDGSIWRCRYCDLRIRISRLGIG